MERETFEAQRAAHKSNNRNEATCLADNIGMGKQNISKLENSPEILEETLEKLTTGLGISIDFIKYFNEEKVVHNIQSNNLPTDYLQ